MYAQYKYVAPPRPGARTRRQASGLAVFPRTRPARCAPSPPSSFFVVCSRALSRLMPSNPTYKLHATLPDIPMRAEGKGAQASPPRRRGATGTTGFRPLAPGRAPYFAPTLPAPACALLSCPPGRMYKGVGRAASCSAFFFFPPEFSRRFAVCRMDLDTQ